MPRNPFTVLELPLDATADAIKAAWRRLARQHHPDVTSGDPAVEKRANHTMAEINTAYHELRDPNKRRLHREVAARTARPDRTRAVGAPVSREVPGGPTFGRSRLVLTRARFCGRATPPCSSSIGVHFRAFRLGLVRPRSTNQGERPLLQGRPSDAAAQIWRPTFRRLRRR